MTRFDIDKQDKWTRGVLTHDTYVGECGSALSGGLRARVAFTRVLYMKLVCFYPAEALSDNSAHDVDKYYRLDY